MGGARKKSLSVGHSPTKINVWSLTDFNFWPTFVRLGMALDGTKSIINYSTTYVDGMIDRCVVLNKSIKNIFQSWKTILNWLVIKGL